MDIKKLVRKNDREMGKRGEKDGGKGKRRIKEEIKIIGFMLGEGAGEVARKMNLEKGRGK